MLFRSQSSFEDLSPEQFKEKVKATDNAVVIDCRTPEEIAANALPHQVVLDITDREVVNKIDELDKDKPYFIYCRSGNRSAQLCSYMNSKGFKSLHNLNGGIITWYNKFGNFEL